MRDPLHPLAKEGQDKHKQQMRARALAMANHTWGMAFTAANDYVWLLGCRGCGMVFLWDVAGAHKACPACGAERAELAEAEAAKYRGTPLDAALASISAWLDGLEPVCMDEEVEHERRDDLLIELLLAVAPALGERVRGREERVGYWYA